MQIVANVCQVISPVNLINLGQKKGYQRYGNPFHYTKTNLTGVNIV